MNKMPTEKLSNYQAEEMSRRGILSELRRLAWDLYHKRSYSMFKVEKPPASDSFTSAVAYIDYIRESLGL